MSGLLVFLLGLLAFAVVMNIIGWRDYFRHRHHKGSTR
jgi:hypothetical protein